VQLTILGSGSGGNCAYLETGETRLLVDAGLSGRQIRQRLLSIGRTPENLSGVLVTHDHTDHTQGLAVLAAKLRIPVFCNRLTREVLEGQLEIQCEYHLFETGASFELGDTVVETFAVPHDASDPVGYLIRTPAGNVGFLTDLGHATRLVVQRARAAHVLVLETNHDVALLQNDPRRPWSLKQRILSRHGHLSNEAAAEALQDMVTDGLRHVYLAHLSRDCNRPELAREVVQTRLDLLGASHVGLAVTDQHVPSPTLTLATRQDPCESPVHDIGSAVA
jgi:phosphoribosyl 1,2-cyclic phosphodiesterase